MHKYINYSLKFIINLFLIKIFISLDCFSHSFYGINLNSIFKKFQPINYEDKQNLYPNFYNEISRFIQKKYCGNFKNITLYIKTLELPKINKNYGLVNLKCSYKYIKNNKDSEILLKIKKYYTSFSIEYKIFYLNNSFLYKSVLEKENNFTFNDIMSIEFHIHLRENYTESPFIIVIKEKINSDIYAIKIILGIFATFFFTIISIFFFSKNLRMRFDWRNNNIEEIIKEKNNEFRIKEKIETLLNNPKYLGSKLCKKEYMKYGNMCSICLEEFKINKDNISLTPCYHVFHYNCLNNFMKKSINSINCPNCNQNLLIFDIKYIEKT